MMSKTWLPIAMFIGGAVCIAAAVATGGAEADLVLIFPVFSGSSGLFLAGVGLIALSFLTGFAMLALSQTESTDGAPANREEGGIKRKTSYGGVVLIGPVPIAFGSDKRTAFFMLVLGIAAAISLVGILLMLG
jgi:uncharacterized protein (TIGR00304 family)